MSRLTLTFDNGPCPGATEKVLDELSRRNIRTTFFVVGEQLQAGATRELAERAKHAGHWIGNHTLTHGMPLGLRDDEAGGVEEIAAAERVIGSLAQTPKLFRPNGRARYGKHLLSEAAADYLMANRYTVVTWTSVPGDFREPWDAWVPRALADVASRDWTLMVLHDAGGRGIDHLPRFLDALPSDVEIVQEFPDACLPIKDGKPQAHLCDVMTARQEEAQA